MQQVFNFELQAPLSSFTALNNYVHASLYMRTIATENESGNGQAVFNIQENVPNFRKSLSTPIATAPDAQWKEFNFMFPARFRPECMLALHLGYYPQTVDFGGIVIADYGPLTIEQTKLFPVTTFTYNGREPDAEWRVQALQRIDTLRTAKINVQVMQGGAPLKGAKVEVKMINNAFKFGTAVTETYLNINASDNQALRENKARYMQELEILVD